jgi:hypothetical protein
MVVVPLIEDPVEAVVEPDDEPVTVDAPVIEAVVED